MTARDKALAVGTAVAWGFAFVATEYGLKSFSAAQLTALRFVIPLLVVFFVPRPRVPWRILIPIGLTLFTGQFLLLFFAYGQGLPPGVASVTQQLQVFFTVLLAAGFLRDVPTRQQSLGMVVALGGMGLIALTVGDSFPLAALGLAIASPFSWAVGNVLLKWVGPQPALPLMAWLSLIPPLPALLVAQLDGTGKPLPRAIAGASWQSIVAVLYLGGVATMLAYATWSHLLAHYPAAQVAPFALLVPCVGVIASALIFGERFSLARYAGMGLIVAGLALTVARWRLPLVSILHHGAWRPSAERQLVRRAAGGIQQDDTGDDEDQPGNPGPVH